MAGPSVECVVPGGALLGECPLWSDGDARLYWIDIVGRALHCFDPETGRDEAKRLPGRPGAIALTGVPGRLLVAIENELAFVDWATGALKRWIELEPAGTGNRMNDGRCDVAGRLWVGSMFDPATAGRFSGLLHRVEPSGEAHVTRRGIGVANGLAFSPDARTMYFADTLRETVWAFDYDPASGEASNERVFLDFVPLPGRPDGACVDEDAGYWIACVYGWAVLRVRPDGSVDRRIDLPVERPTMPAFGGVNLDTLYVTSIGRGGSGTMAAGQTEPGGVFAIDAGVRGLPEPRFGAVA